jgi:hypothetical protein
MDDPGARPSPSQAASSSLQAAPNSGSRAVWAALVLIVAAMVGASAGLLAYAGGENAPTSILAGGGAFGGAVLLMLALIHFCSSKS